MICKCKQHLALFCITLVSDPIILSYYKCKLCSLHTEGREIIISLPSTVVYARSYQPATHEQICHSTAVGRYGRASTTVDGSRNDNVFTFCEERVPVSDRSIRIKYTFHQTFFGYIFCLLRLSILYTRKILAGSSSIRPKRIFRPVHLFDLHPFDWIYTKNRP